MMPSAASPMFFTELSSVTSPVPMILILPASMPRSANALPSAAGCAPAGTKMKIDSRLMSFARFTNAEEARIAPRALEALVERCLRILARREIRHHRIGLADAALVGPRARGRPDRRERHGRA